MSGLADALARHAEQVPKGPRCTVGQLLQDIDAEDRHLLEKALADPVGFPNRTLEHAVHEEYSRLIREHTWQRHRTGRCACGKPTQ
jgi:hypothetical protein